MAENESSGVEQQIADLERQLQAKRAELGTDQSAPYERAEVHAVIGEQIQQTAPSYQAPATSAAPASDVPSWQDPALAPQVEQLVAVAFDKGIPAAISQAVATGNAALVDALHDVLADHFYQELLSRKKVEPAP